MPGTTPLHGPFLLEAEVLSLDRRCIQNRAVISQFTDFQKDADCFLMQAKPRGYSCQHMPKLGCCQGKMQLQQIHELHCVVLGRREESGIISLENNTLTGRKKKGTGGRTGQEEKAGGGRHEAKQKCSRNQHLPVWIWLSFHCP